MTTNELAFELETVCRVVHAALRVFEQRTTGRTIPDWDSAPDWLKKATQQGVQFVQSHPDQTAEEQHEHWMERKLAKGWKHGPQRDSNAKTHPDLVPFCDLSPITQAKDRLLIAIVRSLKFPNV